MSPILLLSLVVIIGSHKSFADTAMMARAAFGSEHSRARPIEPLQHSATRRAPEGRNSVLDQVVAIDLSNVTVATAIDRIADAAHAAVVVRTTDLALLNAHVSIKSSHISVGDAFRIVLTGTGCHIEAPGGSSLQVVRDPIRDTAQPGGVILLRGTVADAVSHIPLEGATVQIDGTSRVRTTGSDGKYMISGLTRGEHAAMVRRLGYESARRIIVLDTAQAYVADFSLQPSPAVLQQVVTTMTGDRHLVEMGNSIGVIGVDSIVGNAPVRSLSDVITARVPGLQVFTVGGETSTSPPIAIRGLNSYNSGSQPLLYIDGVRVNNSSSQPTNYTPSFNDIPPEEIATIEVVKGPSAAALYGTDAANGVIVITTKRGTVSAPQWSVFAEHGTELAPRDEFSGLANFFGWGHDPSGNPVNCTDILKASGGCSRDSVTHFSPLLSPASSPLGTGGRDNYGVQVAGGTSQTRYFFGGSYTDETGYLRMSPSVVSVLQTERGPSVGVPSDEQHPDFNRKYSLRPNVTTTIGSALTLSASASYLSEQLGGNPGGVSLQNGFGGTGYSGGGPAIWTGGSDPSTQFAARQLTSISHGVFSGSAEWHPLTWLSARGIAGVDVIESHYDALSLLGDSVPGGAASTGYKIDAKTSALLYTYTLTATARTTVLPNILSATTVGGNYTRSMGTFSQENATSLGPGCESTACSSSPLIGFFSTSDNIVAGSFIEQSFAIADRLFLTGGLRADAGSTFGTAYEAALYPKASVSWVVTQEPFFPKSGIVQTVRLRGAFGESGTQPSPTAKLNVEQATPALIKDSLALGTGLPTFGSPNLKPERQQELEGGVDVDLINGRIHFEGTVFSKRTTDALVNVMAPASQGGYAEIINAGSVSDRGLEGLISVRPVDSRLVSWNVSVNASVTHNRLVSLGPEVVQLNQFQPSLKVGDPLYSWFDFPVKHVSGSTSGIILPSQLTIDTALQYIGPSYPPTQVTGASTLSLFGGQLQLRGQVDYRGGFYELDFERAIQGSSGVAETNFDSHAPLSDRIRIAASQVGSFYGYIENASFVRLREVAATYNLPSGLLRATPLRSAAITISGRNLAVWTRYGGVDPEDAGAQNGQSFGAYAGGAMIPPSRYWTVRFTANF
jgi:TonB-dependent SusC/RagA subfamily outer membrane receptor